MAEEESLNDLVDFAGQNTSMAMLGNIDMDGVDAVRYENLLQGSYVFQTESASRVIQERTDKQTQEKIPVQVVLIKVIVAECRALVKEIPGMDLEEMKGKVHTEKFFMRDADGVGRFKAFMEDSKFPGSGTLDEVCAAMKGHAFIANIVHRKNTNDPDNPYANIAFPKEKRAA